MGSKRGTAFFVCSCYKVVFRDGTYPRKLLDEGKGDREKMTLDEFRATLTQSDAPTGLSAPLRALWEDAQGRWDSAHRIAQDVEDEMGSWVHAYLHRKEGDLGNAAYWYRRARQPIATGDLDSEWARIVTTLLRGGSQP